MKLFAIFSGNGLEIFQRLFWYSVTGLFETPIFRINNVFFSLQSTIINFFYVWIIKTIEKPFLPSRSNFQSSPDSQEMLSIPRSATKLNKSQTRFRSQRISVDLLKFQTKLNKSPTKSHRSQTRFLKFPTKRHKFLTKNQ